MAVEIIISNGKVQLIRKANGIFYGKSDNLNYKLPHRYNYKAIRYYIFIFIWYILISKSNILFKPIKNMLFNELL